MLVLHATVHLALLTQIVAPKWCAAWQWQAVFSSSPGWQKRPTLQTASSHRHLLDWRTACVLPPPWASVRGRVVLHSARPTRLAHERELNRGLPRDPHIQHIDHGLSHAQRAVERTNPG